MGQNIDQKASHQRFYASDKSRNRLVMVRHIFPSAQGRMDGKLSEKEEGRKEFEQRKPYNN